MVSPMLTQLQELSAKSPLTEEDISTLENMTKQFVQMQKEIALSTYSLSETEDEDGFITTTMSIALGSGLGVWNMVVDGATAAKE